MIALLHSLVSKLGSISRLDPGAADRIILTNAARLCIARGMREEMAHEIITTAFAEEMSDAERAIARLLMKSITRPDGTEGQQVLRIAGYCDCGDNRSKPDGTCLRCGKPIK